MLLALYEAIGGNQVKLLWSEKRRNFQQNIHAKIIAHTSRWMEKMFYYPVDPSELQ